MDFRMGFPSTGLARAAQVLAVLCMACSSSSSPSPSLPDDLASVLEPFRADAGMPALGGAVFRGSTLLALGATGVWKLGDPTPATSADEWHLGSDTKAMTATLIGIFVDKGSLQFSDTLGALFAGETIDPGFVDVTLDELLQHRGGMPANIPADIWAQMWAERRPGSGRPLRGAGGFLNGRGFAHFRRRRPRPAATGNLPERARQRPPSGWEVANLRSAIPGPTPAVALPLG